jgi:hypothetical protein
LSHITGGSPFGQGDSLIDARRAVLLQEVHVVLVDSTSSEGTVPALAMELAGRINKTQQRSTVLYVMNEDGAAAIISQLLGLAQRIGPQFLADLTARIEALPMGEGEGS